MGVSRSERTLVKVAPALVNAVFPLSRSAGVAAAATAHDADDANDGDDVYSGGDH